MILPLRKRKRQEKEEERKYKPLLTSLGVYGDLRLYHSFIHALTPSGVRSVIQMSF